MNELNRYNRQELIEGWNQKRLTDATVSIIGSDFLAQYVAIPLVALGVGNVRLIDDTKARGEAFLDMELKGGSKAASLEQMLKVMNPSVSTRGYGTQMIGDAAKYFLQGSQVVIDTTNSPRSKALAIESVLGTDAQGYMASCSQYSGKILRFDREDGPGIRYLLNGFVGAEQGETVSMVLGGLIAEEVKKDLMAGTDPLKVPLCYNLTDKDRFSSKAERQAPERLFGEFYGRKALMIGAGALGNFVAIGLARMGVGQIDVIDPDTVEDTNLNRQVLYYDCVDKEKASALSAKIRTMGRGLIKSAGFVGRFDENSAFDTGYDLILDCVDSFIVRAVISDYAIAHKVPLISGGTDYQAGQVAVYVPGKTACMDCQLSIHDLARKADERRKKIGCIEAPNPSVIMTNQIIAGIMTNEARTVFCPQRYGEPINGIIKYGSGLENRAGVTRIGKICDCKARGGLTVEYREIQ